MLSKSARLLILLSFFSFEFPQSGPVAIQTDTELVSTGHGRRILMRRMKLEKYLIAAAI
jgi:hypothetical protein